MKLGSTAVFQKTEFILENRKKSQGAKSWEQGPVEGRTVPQWSSLVHPLPPHRLWPQITSSKMAAAASNILALFFNTVGGRRDVGWTSFPSRVTHWILRSQVPLFPQEALHVVQSPKRQTNSGYKYQQHNIEKKTTKKLNYHLTIVCVWEPVKLHFTSTSVEVHIG